MPAFIFLAMIKAIFFLLSMFLLKSLLFVFFSLTFFMLCLSLLLKPFYLGHFLRSKLVSAETTYLCLDSDYLGTARTLFVQASATVKTEYALVGCLLSA